MPTIKLPASPFADRTFDLIMADMLAQLPATGPTGKPLDIRMGSLIWDSLAPTAQALVEAFIQADLLLQYSFIDTSYGAYLDLRAAEHGVTRLAAVQALATLTVTGVAGTAIPTNSQFSTVVNPNVPGVVQAFQTISPYQIQPRVGNGTYQELDTSIVYTGIWTADASSKFSATTGDTADIYFTGTQIVITFDTGPAKGIAQLLVDGVVDTTVDTYTVGASTVTYTKAALTAGNHKVTVRVNGTRNGGSTGFTINLDQFVITGQPAGAIIDTVQVPVTAVTGGVAGNVGAGSITRLASNLTGLTGVSNTLAAVGGVNAESDAVFKARFKVYVASPPASANAAQYIVWAKAASPLVGNANVQPLWNGAGTVKVFLVDTTNAPASGAIITAVQTYIDPAPAGTGAGVAPIGATVTVVAPTSVPIDINVTITYAVGYDPASVRTAISAAFTLYLNALAIADTVRFSGLADAIHDVPGVTDYSVLQFRRGVAAFAATNIVLATGEKATLGVVVYS